MNAYLCFHRSIVTASRAAAVQTVSVMLIKCSSADKPTNDELTRVSVQEQETRCCSCSASLHAVLFILRFTACCWDKSLINLWPVPAVTWSRRPLCFDQSWCYCEYAFLDASLTFPALNPISQFFSVVFQPDGFYKICFNFLPSQAHCH